MSAVVGAIWSLVAVAGAGLASSAPFGAAGHGGQYLAGHVLLGFGLGQLLAAVIRFAVRQMVRKAASRPVSVSLAAVPAVEGAPAAADTPAANAAAVTVLYPRPAAVAALRGRHAA
jgi:hypothetical protein